MKKAKRIFLTFAILLIFSSFLATNAYADENGFQNLTWLITDEYDLYIYADDTADEWAAYRNDIVTATVTGFFIFLHFPSE